MSGKPISALEYFRMVYRELNPHLGLEPEHRLPVPARPTTAPAPAGLRRIFPDVEPATIRQQLTESRYDFSKADYLTISDVTGFDIDTGEKQEASFALCTWHVCQSVPVHSGCSRCCA